MPFGAVWISGDGYKHHASIGHHNKPELIILRTLAASKGLKGDI